MNTVILQTTARFLIGLLLIFAVFIFLRGHNAPGGGFLGGLGVAAAVTLYAFAFGPEKALRFLRIDPRTLVGWGLLVAGASGLAALFAGDTFMAGQWTTLDLPGTPELKIGTPLLFDLGVAMVVVGVGVTILVSLASEGRHDD